MPMKSPHARRIILIAAASAALLLLTAGAALGFQASERPGFCTSCHEMEPYHTAWQKGAHSSVSCVKRHVDEGLVNHLTHKAIAARELWVHLTGDPRFPQGDADVPDSRCLACHESIPRAKASGFAHAEHRKAGGCVTCHSTTGHRVRRRP